MHNYPHNLLVYKDLMKDELLSPSSTSVGDSVSLSGSVVMVALATVLVLVLFLVHNYAR